jgi:hypothetical protein
MQKISIILSIIALAVAYQPDAKAEQLPIQIPAPVAQTGGTASVSSTCLKIDELGVATCLQTQIGIPYKCSASRFAPKCKSVINTYFKSTGEIISRPVIEQDFKGLYPGSGWITANYNGSAYGCQRLQRTGSGGHVEPPAIQGCGKLITWEQYDLIPRTADGLLLTTSTNLWLAPWIEPHYTSGYQLWSSDRNEVSDVSDFGFVVTDTQVGNFAYFLNSPMLCTDTCAFINLPNLGINNFGDYVGGATGFINGEFSDLSLIGVTKANDINDAGEIAGQCGTVACIAKLDPPIVDNSCSGTGETINNLSPRGGWFSTLTGLHRVDYTQSNNVNQFGIGSIVDYSGVLDLSGVFCIASTMTVY